MPPDADTKTISKIIADLKDLIVRNIIVIQFEFLLFRYPTIKIRIHNSSKIMTERANTVGNTDLYHQ